MEILGELSFEEIEHLKWLLKHLQVEDCPIIPRYQLEMADMVDLVDLIVEICGQQSVEVTREILKEMNRMDLVWSLSDTSSANQGKLCELIPSSNINHLIEVLLTATCI